MLEDPTFENAFRRSFFEKDELYSGEEKTAKPREELDRLFQPSRKKD